MFVFLGRKGEGVVGVLSNWTKRELYPNAVRSGRYSAVDGVRWPIEGLRRCERVREGLRPTELRLCTAGEQGELEGEHGAGEPGNTVAAQVDIALELARDGESGAGTTRRVVFFEGGG